MVLVLLAVVIYKGHIHIAKVYLNLRFNESVQKGRIRVHFAFAKILGKGKRSSGSQELIKKMIIKAGPCVKNTAVCDNVVPEPELRGKIILRVFAVQSVQIINTVIRFRAAPYP
jgi:hypothetical protein